MAPAVPHGAGHRVPAGGAGGAWAGDPESLHWGQHRLLAQPASRET